MDHANPSRPYRSRRRTIVGWSAALVCLGAIGWWTAWGADMESIQTLVRKRFPEVRQLSTQELAEWLKSDRRKPVLLDVRDASEFAISHLANASRVDPSAKSLDSAILKDTPLVTYCSVGWRSSALAERLMKSGYTNVANLEGSLFKWANEDRPIESKGKPATTVHPYSRVWGGLLKAERRGEPLKDY